MPRTGPRKQSTPVVWDSLLKLAFWGVLLVMACMYGGSAFIISGLAGGCLLLGLHYAGHRAGGRWMLICRVFVALWCIAYGIGGALLTYAAQKGAVERSVIPWLICLAAIALGLHGLIKACPYRKVHPAVKRGADGCDRQMIEDKTSTERTGSSG